MLAFPAPASRGDVQQRAARCAVLLAPLRAPAELQSGAGQVLGTAGISLAQPVLGTLPRAFSCTRGGSLFSKISAWIPLCPTCFGDREKLKPLPRRLAG